MSVNPIKYRTKTFTTKDGRNKCKGRSQHLEVASPPSVPADLQSCWVWWSPGQSRQRKDGNTRGSPGPSRSLFPLQVMTTWSSQLRLCLLLFRILHQLIQKNFYWCFYSALLITRRNIHICGRRSSEQMPSRQQTSVNSKQRLSEKEPNCVRSWPLVHCWRFWSVSSSTAEWFQ